MLRFSFDVRAYAYLGVAPFSMIGVAKKYL
jgi:hypothetical protein